MLVMRYDVVVMVVMVQAEGTGISDATMPHGVHVYNVYGMMKHIHALSLGNHDVVNNTIDAVMSTVLHDDR